jgi:transposase-like protein
VRIVQETNKSLAQVARDLGINAGTLGNWVPRDRAACVGVDGLSTDDAAELKRLRAENAELRMERDVLKRPALGVVGEGGDEVSVARFIADQRTNHHVPQVFCCRTWVSRSPGTTSGSAANPLHGSCAAANWTPR